MWFQNIFRRESRQEAAPPRSAADLSLSPQAFQQLNRLRLNSSQHLRGAGAGLRRSRRRRPASDFREHRKYVAGDDIRFVDWKASARSEQVFLKQGEQPQETTVHLLLDASASMNWGEPPKRDAVVRLAAALGYLALNGDDRLNALPLKRIGSESPDRPLPRLKGKGQFSELWNRLKELTFEGQCDLAGSFRSLARHSRGGIVLLLSDLLDMPDLDKALDQLPRPAWEVAVLQTLHPQEISPGIRGEFEMVDLESGKKIHYDVTPRDLEEYETHLKSRLDGIERTCIEHNALYTRIATDQILETGTLPRLLRIGLLETA